jgi:hypothetical protein
MFKKRKEPIWTKRFQNANNVSFTRKKSSRNEVQDFEVMLHWSFWTCYLTHVRLFISLKKIQPINCDHIRANWLGCWDGSDEPYSVVFGPRRFKLITQSTNVLPNTIQTKIIQISSHAVNSLCCYARIPAPTYKVYILLKFSFGSE